MVERSLRTPQRPRPNPPPLLTARQWEQVRRCQGEIRQAGGWHGDLPVLLLERCWLRLVRVPVERLLLRLPPDGSRDAPELEHYRRLLAAGHPDWQAQQLCWEEFGPAACRDALLRFWDAQDRGDRDWTLERYQELIRVYRNGIEQGGAGAVPLLVLGRIGPSGEREPHHLHWLPPEPQEADRPMRHTCP